MSAEKMITKIDTVVVFNEILAYLAKQKESGVVLPRHLEVLDMKFELIWNHLNEIGARAIVLQDPYIQARLVAIGVLVATEKEPDAPAIGVDA